MSKIIHFKSLNQLRAIAAFLVIFHHIELYKHRLALSSIYDIHILNYFVGNLGKNGVYLFFVLSGFLITYLILVEKDNTKSINVLKFYGRRIVRIWPLYFLILVISFFLLPAIYKSFTFFFEGQDEWNGLVVNLKYENNLLLFFFFLSNIALRAFGPVVGASQSWSVSVEEQFYFIWPWIVKFFYNKLIYALVGIIVFVKLLNFKIDWFSNYSYLQYFIETFTIDFMAIGSIMAIIYKNYKNQLRILITNKYFISIIFFLLIVHLFKSISSISLAILFSFVIVILIERNKESLLLSKLGVWSYGIYMYHPLVMYFSFSTVYYLKFDSILINNILIYNFVFGGTILISYLSYRYFELYFLKFKNFFKTY